MNEGIVVFSACDGGAIGLESLKYLGIKVKAYYASEIKPQAITCAKDNHPEIIHVGNLLNIDYVDGILITDVGNFEVNIDFVIGGTPCQDFSILQVFGKGDASEKRKGLEGIKSRLFYKYHELRNKIEPAYFFLENVKMKKNAEIELNEYMGVEGLHINSKLVSFQSRPRIYWGNIPFMSVPEDRMLSFQYFKDTDTEYCDKFKVNPTPSRLRMWNDGKGRTDMKSCKNITNSDKIGCLTRKQDRAPNSGLIKHGDFCRYLTTNELEQAQGLPKGYCKSLTKNQAEDILGDGWNLPTIVHLWRGLKTILG